MAVTFLYMMSIVTISFIDSIVCNEDDISFSKGHNHNNLFDDSNLNSPENFLNLIKKMDSNSDGFVSEEELKNWMFEGFKKSDYEDAVDRLKDQDTDKDGAISFPEFLAAVYKQTELDIQLLKSSADPQSRELYELVAEDMRRFKLADENKDGVLDGKEYGVFLHSQSYSQMAPLEIQAFIKLYDNDKDGKVSFDEIASHDKYDNATMDHEKSHFMKCDGNKDGVLNDDEIKCFASPGVEDAVQSETEHLMSFTDSNKDNKLSYEEILTQKSKWLGSQATNYGKHLNDEL